MKKLVLNGSLILAVALSALLFMGADQRTQGRSPNSLLKPTGTPTATLLNINRYSTWYSSNGEQERNPYTTNSGTTYPRGTSQCIYSAGLIWGGMFYDGRTPELRVNGQSYENGTKPGAILGFRTGRAEDPGSADVRIWRIRRDYKTMSTSDAKRDASELYSKALSAVTDGDVQRVRDQYEKDWMEWPAVKGAPYYDKDGDGVYNPTVDEPGVAGADQVIWYVCNDIGQPQPWLCPETGMEEQVTIWGYARTDPLGNIIFKKFRLIYKGTSTTPATATVENMYLCQWSDPDLGNSGDDYAACDTVLSMNYVYNSGPVDANYALFNLPPPAAGYDFLQGPMVRGFAGQDRNRNGIDDAADFAIFDLKKRGPGVINLPMTSAMYFAAGQQYSDPPFTYLGAIQWYQMLRGLPPTPQGPPDPAMRINPTTNQPTPFWVSGDPVAGTGWLDNSPGDRRILLTSGPFTMAVGDTQELVSALVAGLGSNNLQSISTMKFNDKFVQTAYDSLFKLPGPPEKPSVAGVGLSNGFDGTRIMVNWGLDSASIARTESVVVIGNYRFEGYKLYQFPDASGDLESAILIGQYDLRNGITVIRQPVVDPITGEAITMPVQYGSDNGIPYTVTLERDAVGGVSFVPGQRYYYGITAYNYCYDALNPTKTYESQPATITVIPETARPGDRFPYFFGDTIAVSNAIGTSNAVVIPLVYNPYLTKGTTYRLRIDTVELGGVPKWSLKNMTSGKVLTSNRTALAYPTTAGGLLDLPVDSAYNVTESGFKMYVVNSQTGVRTVRDANGANVLGRNSSNPAFDILTVDSTTNQVRGLNGGNNNRDFELRFDATGSFALRSGRPPSTQAGSIWVPFSVWDIGRTSTDTAKQVIAFVKWNQVDRSILDRWAIDTVGLKRKESDGLIYRYTVFEPISITALAYPNTGTRAGDSAAVKALQTPLTAGGNISTDLNNAIYYAYVRPKIDSLPPPVGTRIRFTKWHAMAQGDVKTITPDAVVTGDLTLAKQDVDQVKAFPNPYYGLNSAETDKVNRFITFSHLPTNATLRVFNLAGVLVATLYHGPNAQKNPDLYNSRGQYLDWLLKNNSLLPVASGIYIVYIEMPDLGVTKTYKVAIIQEQQFLRNY